MSAAAKLLPFPVQNHVDDFGATCFARCEPILRGIIEALSKEHDKMNLETLSNELFKRGKTLNAALLGAAMEERIRRQGDLSAHPCPGCGVSAPGKGAKARSIDTRHGPISFSRPYYYCSPCGAGFFPADEELQLAADAKQYDIGRIAVGLLEKMPYAEAEQVFKMTIGEDFSAHCMHGLAQALGEEATIENVLPTKEEIEAKVEREGHRRPIMIVSADGAHEPLRPTTGKRNGKRGPGFWKEAKGFRIYMAIEGRISHIASWHQICGESDFGEAITYAATLIPQDKCRIALVGDGASWIWKHLKKAFPGGREILDYFHVSEYVHSVAKARFGSGTIEGQQWCESTLGSLCFGEVDTVLWDLKRMKKSSTTGKTEITTFSTYLTNHAEKINYRHNKLGGYPSGSGGMESANKYICHARLKRSGAWWYEANANKMLLIRCADYNGRLDHLFEKFQIAARMKKRSRRKTTVGAKNHP